MEKTDGPTGTRTHDLSHTLTNELPGVTISPSYYLTGFAPNLLDNNKGADHD